MSKLIIDTNLDSLHNSADDETTLNIKAWDNGVVFFTWIHNNKVIDTVDFCVNAYFRMLVDFGGLFANLGEFQLFECCDENSDAALVCVHGTESPEITMAVTHGTESPLTAFVALARGALLTVLDEIGYRLANLENLAGCGEQIDDENAEIEPACAEHEHNGNDPFVGMNMSVRH